MNNTPLKGKENNSNYDPGQSPHEMTAMITHLNNQISNLTSENATLMEIISKLEKTIESLNQKIMVLEVQLQLEKERRLKDSDSSNSPPAVKD
ncbi:unnamed protein product [Adineta ricciae]|uniref:Uncharacterized protein n=1 Tax=Adineta ricciae TaxID=249248 RepID=A0A815V9V3_ADIRI|nr:unnamed protein product [Adineta ricciae]